MTPADATSPDEIEVSLRYPRAQFWSVARTVFLAAYVVIFALAAAYVNGAGARVVLIVLAVLLLALTVASVFIVWPPAWRPRVLAVSRDAITRRADVDPWRLAWTELRVLFLDVGSVRVRGSNTNFAGKGWRVTLRVRPYDPASFTAAHPELAGFRGSSGARKDEWAIEVIEDRKRVRALVAALDAALSAHGGSVYDGLLRIGKVPGT